MKNKYGSFFFLGLQKMLNEGCKTHDSSMIDADHEFLMRFEIFIRDDERGGDK